VAGADAEQGLESGMPSAATVEAEDKLIEVGLKVLAAPASTSTHSPSAWSYQKPGGLAWPRETIRSTRKPGRVSSVATCSAARASASGERRFTGRQPERL